MKQAGNKAGADSLDGIVAGLTMQPVYEHAATHVSCADPGADQGSLQNQSDGVFRRHLQNTPPELFCRRWWPTWTEGGISNVAPSRTQTAA
jgi:hypothetical protein